MKLLILLILVTNSFHVLAQSYDAKEYADYQYDLGNYNIALREYLRFHHASSDSPDPKLLERIADCSMHTQNSDLAIKFLNFAQNISLEDTLYYNSLCFKKNQVFVLDKKYKQAALSLFEMNDISDAEMDRFQFYLGLNYILSNDVEKGFAELMLLSYISEDDQQVLDILERKFERTFVNKFTFKEFMSYLIPGSGQALLGNYGDGINSFVINGTFLYLLFNTIESLSLVDGLLGVGPWFIRYYMGGIKNTQIQEADSRSQERVLYTSQLLNYLQSKQNRHKE